MPIGISATLRLVLISEDIIRYQIRNKKRQHHYYPQGVYYIAKRTSELDYQQEHSLGVLFILGT